MKRVLPPSLKESRFRLWHIYQGIMKTPLLYGVRKIQITNIKILCAFACRPHTEAGRASLHARPICFSTGGSAFEPPDGKRSPAKQKGRRAAGQSSNLAHLCRGLLMRWPRQKDGKRSSAEEKRRKAAGVGEGKESPPARHRQPSPPNRTRARICAVLPSAVPGGGARVRADVPSRPAMRWAPVARPPRPRLHL
jgi:hypothetical protein